MRHDLRVGKLTHVALSNLWLDSPDAAPGDSETDEMGCCPVCCAACSALADLLRTGDLDAWVLAWPDTLSGTSWWNDYKRRVDRSWLLRAWSGTARLACHNGRTDAEREVANVLDLLRAG